MGTEIAVVIVGSEFTQVSLLKRGISLLVREGEAFSKIRFNLERYKEGMCRRIVKYKYLQNVFAK
jgi:hypothetical protein